MYTMMITTSRRKGTRFTKRLPRRRRTRVRASVLDRGFRDGAHCSSTLMNVT